MAIIKSITEWNKQRSKILNAFQAVSGKLPGNNKRCDFDIKIIEEVDCGKYIRRLIHYKSEPNGITPAFLCIPKKALKQGEIVPGVLCLHPTDSINGHKVVVGLSEKAHRSYASELAEQGFVTIAPSYPRLADYQPDLESLGYQSGTMKAIWDNIRALDLLETLPYVRKSCFAAIGHSLGGHNSIFTAVFDERIKVIVSSCGFDSFQDYMDGDLDGWISDRYMPKLKDYPLKKIPFDFHDLLAALAPRICFISAPIEDSNFKWQSVDRMVDAASKIYALYHKKEHLIVEHPSCGHDFPDTIRTKAYKIIKQSAASHDEINR